MLLIFLFFLVLRDGLKRANQHQKTVTNCICKQIHSQTTHSQDMVYLQKIHCQVSRIKKSTACLLLWRYAHASPRNCLVWALVLEPHFAQSCGRFLLLTWGKVFQFWSSLGAVLRPLIFFVIVEAQNGVQKWNPKQGPKLDPNQNGIRGHKLCGGASKVYMIFIQRSAWRSDSIVQQTNNFNQRRKGNLGGQNCSNREHEYIRRPNIVKTCFTCRRYTVKSHAWENQQHACYCIPKTSTAGDQLISLQASTALEEMITLYHLRELSFVLLQSCACVPKMGPPEVPFLGLKLMATARGN